MANRIPATRNSIWTLRIPSNYPEEAQCSMPLECNVFMRRGQWAINFTRATTATVTDFEWYVKPVLSGEARFLGARRVRNLAPYSQDVNFCNKFSLTVSGTKVAYTDGSLIGQTIISDATTAVHYVANGTWPVIIWNTYLFSVSVKAAWVNYVQLAFAASTAYQNFNLTNWSMTGTAGAGSVVDEWNGWYRCTVKFVSTLGTNAGQGIAIISSMSDGRLQSNLWDGISGVSVCRMQLEDVTGQSIQTPSEYVSTNVLSSPYHGAMVDWVKYFDTDVNWVAIPKTTLKWLLAEWQRTNICNYSDLEVSGWWLTACTRTYNAGIAPDGTNSMVKIIPNVGTQSSYAYNVNITTTAQQYTVSCYVKADWFNFVQFRFSASISSWYANFDLQNGVVWTRSLWTSSGIETTSIAWVYRVWAVTDTVAATTAAIAIQVVPDANSGSAAPVTWDWVSGILAWGMQVENWINASSYIPTTTTTVTRNIDSLIINTKNAIDTYGACSFIATIEDNSQFDRRMMWFTGNTPNRLQFQVKRWLPGANLFYWDGSIAQSVTPGQDVWANNVVIAWTNLSNVSLYMNNTKYNSGVAPNLIFTTVDIGSASGISWFWCIKNVRIWKTRPTDAELLALSNSSY